MADSTDTGHGADALLRARRTRVTVVGGGVAGLVAALEWAKIGAHVTVCEAGGRLGGALETADLDGIPIDLVADAFSLSAPALGGLIDDLRLRDRVEEATPLPVVLAGAPGRASGIVPLPEQTVLGIPANPWADDVRRVIGWSGAWRAYLDRLRPPLTIGHERSLGRLVRQRMGDRVAGRLVAPVTWGLYGVDPDDVDVEAAAPGLSTALTRTGSLAGAVFDLLPPEGHAAAHRATLRGGFGALATALAERLLDLGADLRVGHPVTSIAPGPDGTWTVRASPVESAMDAEATAAPDAAPFPDPAARPAADSGAAALTLDADVVIVATGAAAATALLSGLGVEVSAHPAPCATSSTSSSERAALAAGARASTPSPPEVKPQRAHPYHEPARRALRHLPERGVALAAAAAGPERQVVRVTLPPTRPVPTSRRSTPRSPQRARCSARHSVRRARRRGARSCSNHRHPSSVMTTGSPRCAVRWRAPASRSSGRGCRGGVAQVVTDAVAETDRVRSAVLWGEPADPDDADPTAPR
ncbi:MAG: FAD-dependent oxidoreductase [Microbacterium sp.]